MSRDFSSASVQPYQLDLTVAAIKIASQSGQSSPLLIPWSTYGAPSTVNVGVYCDLSDSSVSTPIGQIRSVYIDNMGSQNAIYIQFNDTGYTVVAKPNSSGWFPVFTNQFKFTVYGLGFSANSVPTTKVLITNLALGASINVELEQEQPLWLASSQITRGNTIYNQNVGVPALGDQFTQPFLNLSINDIKSNLFGTPYASGFVYITAMDVYVGAQSNAGGQCTLFFESTGISGVFTSMDFGFANNAFSEIADTLVRINGNWKIDATQTWRLRNQINFGAMSGACRFSFSFTVNPN